MAYPKQFLNLCGPNTLLQDTLLRINDLCISQNIVICNEDHRFVVAEQLREINQLENSTIILEPFGKNTAPAIALACFSALKNKQPKEEESLLLVLAADHVITDPEQFLISINESVPYAINDKLITFGISPYKPETGYGYIKRGSQLSKNVYKVDDFVEKPDLADAQAYIHTGNYFWNSGIFLFKASIYLSELERLEPELFETCRKSMQDVSHDLDFIRPQKDIFSMCPSKSIDYAVMEHTDNSVMLTTSMKWSDVGSWTSLWETLNKDQNGNYIKGDVITQNTTNCFVQSELGLVATIGVEDLIVVNTADAVLVSSKNHVQDVKVIYEKLSTEGRVECINHKTIYRPWGFYTIIGIGNGFQIRRLTIKPGSSIDEQVHYHRAEHWIVVQGTAEVIKNDELIILKENHSTYISSGDVHIVRNSGESLLEIVEIQTGLSLTEDDNHPSFKKE